MLAGFKIWFKHRPDINSQNTGHEAFQRPTGLTNVPWQGGAGFVTGTMHATYPMGITPGNTLVRADPTVTGNPSRTLGVDPLSLDRLTQITQGLGVNL